MALAAQVLPITDRLFFTKDEAIVDAGIELVQVIVKKFSKEIEKNHSGSKYPLLKSVHCRMEYYLVLHMCVQLMEHIWLAGVMFHFVRNVL